jgi:hypothetical protein
MAAFDADIKGVLTRRIADYIRKKRHQQNWSYRYLQRLELPKWLSGIWDQWVLSEDNIRRGKGTSKDYGFIFVVVFVVVLLFAFCIVTVCIFTSRSLATLVPTQTVTAVPTLTYVIITQTPISYPTDTPTCTTTPAPTPTLVPSPTITPKPVGYVPVLKFPEPGLTYRSPIVFQWQGTLNAGQVYLLHAWHSESGYSINRSLSTTGWTTDLPWEKFGEWQWNVSVLQNGSVIRSSATRMFWFDPFFNK